MNGFDQMTNSVRNRQNVTISDLRQVDLIVGDIVHIPYELLSEYDKKTWADGMKAEVIQRCSYHVVVKLEIGFTKSIQLIDCFKLKMIKPATYVSNDEAEDILNAKRGNRNE